MKTIISILLMLSAFSAGFSAVAAEDRNSVCKCNPVVREDDIRGYNLWVYWTAASGHRHHDMNGKFSSREECIAEALNRECHLQ